MRSIPYGWSIVAMLCAISTISYVQRVNVTVVGDYLMRDFRIDQTRLGGLFTAFSLGYALFQFPAGLRIDRIGPRRMLAGALLCWGGLTLLTALAEHLVLTPGLVFGIRSWLCAFCLVFRHLRPTLPRPEAFLGGLPLRGRQERTLWSSLGLPWGPP